MFYNFKKNKKAFTLVELIVVIAILAILGTVVGVTVSGYVDKSKENSAKSNIDSVKSTVQYFITDSEDKIKAYFATAIGDLDVYTTLTADCTNTEFETKTVTFYVQNGKYYGVVTFTNGVAGKSSTTTTKPSGTFKKVSAL